MRHKTSGYFLLSVLLVSLILGLCILLNLRCPQAVSDDALTQEQLTRGVTLTGWQQTGPGHWRFAFEAPADVPELVLCLSTRSLDAVPEGLEPTDQRGEAFWVRPVPGRTSEITVTSTTVPQMWLMLPDTLWHWRELRSSLQLMALVAFASMGAGILALFCFKPQHELGVFLLYLGVMFGWGLAVLLPAGQTGALLGFLMGLYFPFAVLTPSGCAVPCSMWPFPGAAADALRSRSWASCCFWCWVHPPRRYCAASPCWPAWRRYWWCWPGHWRKKSARPGICWQATS